MEQTQNTTPQERTREEIDALKIQWRRDPIWDLEESVGFEAHADELKAYRMEIVAANEKRAEEAARRARQIHPHDAFYPLQKWAYSDYSNSAQPDAVLPGASIRTQIAAQIMASLAGAYNSTRHHFAVPGDEYIAREAVALTDALIEELNK